MISIGIGFGIGLRVNQGDGTPEPGDEQVDKFMPALSVKDLFTKITDFSLEGVYQANGTFKAIPGGLNISTPIIDVVPNTVYRLKSLATAHP